MLKFIAAAGLGLALVPAALAETAPLQQMRTARSLYEIGIAQQNPLLILAAARLRKSVTPRPSARNTEGSKAITGQPLGWQEMLAAAAPLIEGDPALLALAEDTKAERDKGVTIGPVYSIAEIEAKGTDTYPSLPFTGGQYAEIYVEGPAGVDLNVLIRDAQGRLVCSDTDISAIAYCGWRPAASGEFKITVENRSAQGGQYSLISN